MDERYVEVGVPYQAPTNDEVTSVVSANAVINESHEDLTDPRYAVVNIEDVRKTTPVIFLLLTYLEFTMCMWFNTNINLAIK